MTDHAAASPPMPESARPRPDIAMSHALDPLHLPLKGSHLIEASAGTGKTWTIAALYLRLVLGHGEAGTQASRPLQPGEILVMTFTRAATRELSDRIRARLAHAARCFRGEPEALASADGLLAELMSAHPEGETRAQAAWRLDLAAQGMDEAAVHTIDAWCQRMLREHAFDSQCLFEEELIADEQALLEDAVRDYWRQEVYPLPSGMAQVVLDAYAHPGALQQALKPLLGLDWRGHEALHTQLRSQPLHAWMQGPLQERSALMTRAKTELPALVPIAVDWVLKHRGKGQAFDARKIVLKSMEKRRETWLAWCARPDDHQAPFKAADGGFTVTMLSRDHLQRTVQADAEMPDIPADIAHFFELTEALQALPPLSLTLRQHALAGVAARMQWLKRRTGQFSFSDMIERLDRALHSEHGEVLRQRILAQYPAALIDEFQDTSPQQFRLFDALYRVQDNDPAQVLLLIGDPKQSIYGFRGADIHSYLQARLATEGRHHMLATNHRSSQALVQAVNLLFQQAEDRPGQGAFRFRQDGQNPVPFVPVDAKGRRERWGRREASASGGLLPLPAITLHVDAPLRKAAATQRQLAAAAAETLVNWLNDPDTGFLHDDGRWQRLQPSDVAVLVRSGHE
ncbi:MAG: exodeoxyribonuclease V subunit beta, partial [Burkholderiaceae bacterium]